MLLTIVICTYNRAEFLRHNLSVLASQLEHYPEVELLVVDNNSDDETESVVKGFRFAKYLYEPKQGLGFARNCGYKNANGDWVAYLDDDAYVAGDWLKKMVDIAENAHFDAFGGVYVPWYKEGKKSWYLDEYATNRAWLKATSRQLLKSGYFSGGNCCYRRQLLEDLGGFPTGIGMSGDNISYGEEDVLQARARSIGAKLGFDPKLQIHHYTPLKKQNVEWMIKSSWAKGRDYWAMPGRKSGIVYCAFLILFMIPYFIKVCIQSIAKWVAGDYRVANVLLAMTRNIVFQAARINFGVVRIFGRRKGGVLE